MKEQRIIEEQVRISELYSEIFHNKDRKTISKDDAIGLFYQVCGLHISAGNSTLLKDEMYLEIIKDITEFFYEFTENDKELVDVMRNLRTIFSINSRNSEYVYIENEFEGGFTD